ncbi:MAG: hypothetical protein ABIJ12_15280 [bacterium]
MKKKGFLNQSYIRLKVLILLLSISLFVSTETNSENYSDAIPGVIGFKTDRSMLLIPQELVGVIFDTIANKDLNDTAYNWRMIGNLLVDSVMNFGTDSNRYISNVVIDSTQIEGVRFFSAELQSVLEKINPIMLRRRSPRSSFDTSPRWDKYRKRWYNPQDLSVFFRMTFSDTLPIEKVVDWLRQVPGVEEVAPLQFPMPRESDD